MDIDPENPPTGTRCEGNWRGRKLTRGSVLTFELLLLVGRDYFDLSVFLLAALAVELEMNYRDSALDWIGLVWLTLLWTRLLLQITGTNLGHETAFYAPSIFTLSLP